MSPRKRQGGGLVYSTESGRVCPGCGRPATSCRCSITPAPTPVGPARVGLETHGRKGRGVTVVREVPVDAEALAELLKALKKQCGSGGTLKAGAIEIQGDHRETIVAELERRGIAVRRLG